VILNPYRPPASALFGKDREKVLKALAWYERRSFESTEWDIKEALLRIIDHQDWEIRLAVVACLKRRLDHPEFVAAIFRRLSEEKDNDVLAALIEASIMPIMEKWPGHEQARARVATIADGKASVGVRRQCEGCLYWTQDLTLTDEDRELLAAAKNSPAARKKAGY
jgi:HEAT repeats